MDHLLYDVLPLLKHCAFGSIEQNDALLDDIADGAVMEQPGKPLQVVGDHPAHFGLAAIVEIGDYLLEVAHQDFVLGGCSIQEVQQLLPEGVFLLG
jgi:hypothetical protein